MTTVTATPQIASEKLSTVTKVAYGMGDLGTAISAGLRSFFFLIFLTDVAGVSAGNASWVLLLTKVWDAINDPFIGVLSDRTRTRWGRRRPWLLFGALPFGILAFLIWYVPASFTENGRWWWFVAIGFLLDAVYTMINVPYTALTPELTHDYDERTSLNSYRFAFSVGGTLVSVVGHQAILAAVEDKRTAYMISSAIWAVIAVLSCWIAFAFTRERAISSEQHNESSTLPFGEQIRIAFRNVPYRYVISLYLVSWLVLQLVAQVLNYWMTYYMGRPKEIGFVLFALQGSSLLFLFFWSWVSRRLEKRIVYILGACIWIAVQMTLAFVTPDQFWAVYPLAVLGGAGVAVAYLVPWSMMPDVIEFDEYETGLRREGVFYGFMVLLQKLGIAFGLWMVAQALSWSGYISPSLAGVRPEQPANAIFAIRLFMGPIPAVILLASLVIAWRYPITRKKHAEIRERLERRGAESQK